MTGTRSRQGIYYWKCDRAAAFHGTAQGEARAQPALEDAVRRIVLRHFGEEVVLRLGGGQGNHLTWIAEVKGRRYFVRVEDGPERDDYLTVESHVMARVLALGVPTPRVWATDASRREVSFAWQIMDYLPHPDLNQHFKAGTLVTSEIAQQIGRLIALWQDVPVKGFGPFDVGGVASRGELQGLHLSYESYHCTCLEAHVEFLVSRAFLTEAEAGAIYEAMGRQRALLALPRGCLVHKDLALWNVIGSEREIAAVIDWDDCIAGDPMDDLSLLACFHGGEFLRAAFAGYAEVRPLPEKYIARFWLHLLRNMIFKAVIRVGAGYFDRDSRFFLIGAGSSGTSLREQTLARLAAARRGLVEESDPFSL